MIFVIAARALGVENFGLFSSAIAIVGILSKFVDLGIEPIVFREFSKKDSSFHLFSTALTLRLLMYIVVVLLFNLSASIFDFTATEVILINILFLTIIFSAKTVVFRELLSTPFKAVLKMHYPMTVNVLDNLILLFFVIPMLYFDLGLIYFGTVYTLANFPGFLLMFIFLKRKFSYKINFRLENAKWLIIESLPMFGYVILITIFQQADVVILNFLSGREDAGVYSVGLRLTMPLYIIPSAIVTTVFPTLVQQLEQKERSNFISNFVFKILFFISFVLAIVFTFKAEQLVTLIWGTQYSQAAYASSILYWVQVFLFFNFFAIAVLIVHNRQFYNFVYSLLLMGSNLLFAFMLIPDYGVNGAAIAKLTASVIAFSFIILSMSKLHIPLTFRPGMFAAWIILVSVALYLLAQMFSLVYYLSFAIIVIIIITFAVKFFLNEELFLFFKLLHKEELGRRLLKINN